jgi:preprotein translocase subunit SecG
MKEIIKQLLTGKDNQTHDFVRWLGVLAVLVALGLTVYVVVWRGQPFDLQQFGVGMGSVFAALGAALKLKETTEPQS